jgi:hypothetical protein
MTSGKAFLTQARSDWEVYLLLTERRESVQACHELHYLQMTVEKLAKAVICSGGAAPPRTHAVAERLVQLLRAPVMARRLGYNPDQRAAYLDLLRKVAPLFQEIEQLCPAVSAGTDGPNVEYPWPVYASSGAPDWIAPASYPFDLAERLRHGNGPRLTDLLRRLLDRASPA